MPRPRTPGAVARGTGRDQHDPARFEGRNEPIVFEPVGDPPTWVVDTEKCHAATAWRTVASEIPWLNSSHRMLLATLCSHLGRLMAGQEVGVQASIFIKQCLGSMGATPSDASKVGAMPSGDERRDPAEQYF